MVQCNKKKCYKYCQLSSQVRNQTILHKRFICRLFCLVSRFVMFKIDKAVWNSRVCRQGINWETSTIPQLNPWSFFLSIKTFAYFALNFERLISIEFLWGAIFVLEFQVFFYDSGKCWPSFKAGQAGSTSILGKKNSFHWLCSFITTFWQR